VACCGSRRRSRPRASGPLRCRPDCARCCARWRRTSCPTVPVRAGQRRADVALHRRDRVKAVLKRAGVTVLPPQALRRTFTDLASMQGHSLRAIGEMVGHTSTAVTGAQLRVAGSCRRCPHGAGVSGDQRRKTMRINVYSQELTNETRLIAKESDGLHADGRLSSTTAAQLMLHSSPMLHHPPMDDDRSAVTFGFRDRRATRGDGSSVRALARCS